MDTVQSLRGVSTHGGYNYQAYGLYAKTMCADGIWRWKLVDSSPEFRSDKRGRHLFPGVPLVHGVRHNNIVRENLA